ncbi:antibiotic biosynthesis monooxygenase [Enemella evansiae]|uniref:putative quinol monooxygenase n=1 Tax=Enemella evansiae TaxID=2016499 RepID=UPI000B95CB3E|nr:antibiotic biosynthesis monooxygenase [Enemella evansiae]OYO15395.1 antibiotic biosynthesis monooxygenase [Enemella evansiae]
MSYQVIAQYRARPDTADQVAALLPRLAAASRTEAGCQAYTVNRDLEDTARFVIVETYRTAEDLATHRETEHFNEIAVGQIIPLLAHREVSAGQLDPV